MQVGFARPCLTRVVLDDSSIDIAQLQIIMDRIQQMLPRIPAAERDYISNALLSFAVTTVTGRACEDCTPQ